MENKKKVDQLLETWQPVLDAEGEAPIKDRARRTALAVTFENMINEGIEVPKDEMIGNLMEADIPNVSNSLQGSGGDTLARFDPIMVSLVRRAAPMMIGYDLMGVQPMTGPTGLIFALRSGYANTTSGFTSEALFYEANTAFSGNTSITPDALSSDIYANTTTVLETGTGMDTLTGETGEWMNMGMSLEKHQVEARTRKLMTSYSYELVTDLKKVYNIDAEEELTNILTTEITSAQNREMIRTLYNIAVPGGTSNTGEVDLSISSGDINGRWFGEQWKGLVHQIRKDSLKIQKDTRRGAGNVLLVDAETAAALADIKALDYSKMLGDRSSLSEFPDETTSTFVGMLGTMKVFVDPYVNLGVNFYVVGYKGASFGDQGAFLCPYVPLQQFKVVDPTTFEPKMGFKVRYGLTESPFSYGRSQTKYTDNYSTANAHKNVYYRVSNIFNIMG